jgi:acyl-CoA-dependent ceramide synthase
MFVFMWIYQRHYLNLKILWAVLTEFRTVGPFELNWETQQYKCLLSQSITFTLLASLQAVNIFWLFLILRVAKNYVFNKVRRDERSDNEDEEEEEAPSKELSNGSVTSTGSNIHSSATKRNFAKENKSLQVRLNGELINAPILRVNGKESH